MEVNFDDDFIEESFIQAKYIFEELRCPICYCLAVNPVITDCNHLFCKPCLNKSHERSGQCPMCKTNIYYKLGGELGKIDLRINNLIDILRNPDYLANAPSSSKLASLKESLTAYLDLLKDTESKIDLEKKVLDEQREKDLSLPNVNVEQIDDFYKNEIQNLDDTIGTYRRDIEQSIQRFIVDYVKTNKQPVPRKVKIIIDRMRDVDIFIYLDDVDTGDDVILRIYQRCELLNIPIHISSVNSMILTYKEDKKNVTDYTIPLSVISPNEVLEIVLLGNVSKDSKSEVIEHKCIKKDKDKLPKEAIYFCCRDCSLNWICQSCIEVCHSSHVVEQQLVGKFDTRTCYCSKKKNCIL